MASWQQAKMPYKYKGSRHTRTHTHTPPDELNQSSGTAELRTQSMQATKDKSGNKRIAKKKSMHTQLYTEVKAPHTHTNKHEGKQGKVQGQETM